MEENRSSFDKEELRFILVLLAISAVLRLYVALHTAVIAIDGVEYIHCAKAYADLDFTSALGHIYPPLYPILTALLHSLLRDWEVAGQMLSLIAGVALIIPVYLLIKRLYGRRVALIAAFIASFHPQLVLHSAQVRTESLYFLLVALSIYFGWRALTEGRKFFFFLLGLFTSLAYLTRPEGIVILLLFLVWTLSGLASKPAIPPLKRFIGIGCSLIPTVLLAGCYVLLISNIKPEEPLGFRLTLKQDVARILGYNKFILEQEGGGLAFEEPLFTDFLKRWGSNYIQLLGRLLSKALHPLFTLLLLAGIFIHTTVRRQKRFELFILVYVILFIGLFALVRVSIRHPTQMITPLLFLAAIGLTEVNEYLRCRFNLTSTQSRLLFGTLCLLIVVAFLQQFAAPRRGYLAAVRNCGEWIKEKGPYHRPRVATDWARVAFYADGDLIGGRALVRGKRNRGKVRLNRGYLEGLLTKRSADYVAFARGELFKEDEEYLLKHPQLNLRKEFTSPSGLRKRGIDILLFDVLDRKK